MSKTKPKASSKRSGRAGARPARADTRRRAGTKDFPLLPVVVGGALAILAIGLFIFMKASASSSAGVDSSTAAIDGISCDTGEMSQTHYHVHLDILYVNGQPINIPPDVGRPGTCFYWLHTHAGAADSGVIHVESPTGRSYTLGNFFDIWRQPLTSTNVAGIKLTADQQLVMYVDGQPYTGDPRAIPLRPHELITLEITPPTVSPPSFTFPQGE